MIKGRKILANFWKTVLDQMGMEFYCMEGKRKGIMNGSQED